MSNFPAHLFKPADSVLCLFGCGRMGENDLQYLREIGVRDVVVVEIDQRHIDATAPNYPQYTFICGDAFEYIRLHIQRYDVLIADAWLGDHEDRAWAAYDEIRDLAKRHVIMGVSQPRADMLTGFRMLRRSDHKGGVFWAWR